MRNYQWRILIRVLLLTITITAACYLVLQQQTVYLLIVAPLIIFQIIEFYRSQAKVHNELDQFVESIHYRDFSRHFNVKQASTDIQPLRKGFNEINSAFKVISREKETQYQYLQNILELVDTGIISYEAATGDILWMNESLKKMLALPYLRNIDSLQKRNDALYKVVYHLNVGDSIVTNITTDKFSYKVLLSATAFQTDDKKYKLIAFQNIEEALDENEAQAWQKLLSVMTHEIMNSVAPISSLAETLGYRLQAYINKESDSLDDLELGIDTIKRRSEGLLKFASTYRSLNKITTLSLSEVYAADIFENLLQLMQPTMEQKNIEVNTILKDFDLKLMADTSLLEQVLINLIVNAIEAVKESPEPKITLSAYTAPNNKAVIKVADNGPGIPDELLDKIFIPFFSTKKSGSGIGLSLCKQIMLLHKGNIHVQSIPGEGTAFLLVF